MNGKQFIFFGLLLSLFSFCACGDDAEEVARVTNLLEGRWEIEEGYRNGRRTESMDDTFFEFKANNQMALNLTGAREEVPYLLEGQLITPQEGRIKVPFSIEELTEEKLVLSMVMRNIPFKFVLKKAAIMGSSPHEIQ